MTSDEDRKLEVWKVTIDVQKHFNDLSLRVRSIAITVLGAFLAAASVTFKDVMPEWRSGQPSWLTALILYAGLFCWLSFWLMDCLWYHRLLQGAVKHGRQIESELKSAIPGIELTTTIDDASPIFWLRAMHRLTIFYAVIGALLIAAVGVVLHAGQMYFWAVFVTVSLGLAALVNDARVEAKKRSKPDDQSRLAPTSD